MRPTFSRSLAPSTLEAERAVTPKPDVLTKFRLSMRHILLPSWQHVCDGLACLRYVPVVVFAKQSCQRRGYLALCNGRNLRSLAQCGCIGTKECHPYILRVGQLLSVALPVDRRFAATMIGRKD